MNREAWAIRADGLVKRFGHVVALNGVDLEVTTGTVLGLLGPNGAGKTTVVRILTTLLRPDAGHATVGGYDVMRDAVRVRSIIGLTGQYASVDEDLTATQNLLLLGRLLGFSRAGAKARAGELLERFELTGYAHRQAKTYSGGMRRRLDLAASLVGRPKVLYLDEPTTGLDPHVRNEIWHVVRGLVNEGTTVLLTTQYLEEADQLADRITVVDSGRVIADGRPDELKRRLGGHTIQVRPSKSADIRATARILAEVTGTVPITDLGGFHTVPLRDPALLSRLIRRLDAAGVEADEVSLRLPSLDEVFLALTGQPDSRPITEQSVS